MNKRYLDDLRLLKSSFDSKNEAEAILAAIFDTLPQGDLQILDVGIGDGRSAFQLADRLTLDGYRVHLTGIDLHLSKRIQRQAGNNMHLFELGFSELPTHNKYDVVVATQSLYYLGHREVALRKMVEHVKEHGCLILTIWSAKCGLYDLYTRFVRQQKGRSASAEGLVQELSNIDNEAQVSVVYTIGQIDLSKWRSSEVLCRAAFRMLSRVDSFNESMYTGFRSCLDRLPSTIKRINGTVIFRRPKGCQQ